MGRENVMEVKFYDTVNDELLKFAVIISQSNGKWVFCKHKERDTYEVPGGHVITLTREEEMLSMKMRVHDNLGYSVLAAQRMLLRESEADRDVFLSQWKQTLDLLNKDNESVKGEQLHRQVQERAEILGVKIIYTGEQVWESHIFELMDIILLEALSNCVRHAGASELYVKCSSGEQEWIMVITDNGQTTEKDVKEGGGLSGIRKRVEQCGGTLRICAESKFSIIVKIPKEVRR